MDEILSNWPIAKIVILYVIGFNVALAGIKAALDKIKDKTESNWDNAASDLLGKIVGWVQKVLDIIGYNPEHKEPEIKK